MKPGNQVAMFFLAIYGANSRRIFVFWQMRGRAIDNRSPSFLKGFLDVLFFKRLRAVSA